MSRPLALLVHLAFAGVVLLVPSEASPAPPATTAASAIDGATVVRGVGRFRGERGADWSPASVGGIVPPNTTVEASGGVPLEMKFADGTELTMEPNAFGKLRSAARLPSENNGWARGHHLELRGGEVDVRMPSEPRGGRAFLVSTTAGTLTDWRGSVHVTVQDDTTAAAIYEGALVVGSNGQGFAVYDKTGVFLRKGVNPERSRIIPGAPKWSAAAKAIAPSFVVALGDESKPLGFSWDAVDGATTYRVEVASDPGMGNVIKRAVTADTRFVLTEPTDARVAAPRYFARVRAISNDKIVGGWSPPRALRVVRVTYPRESFVANDGTLILPEGGAITLSDVAGVEMAVETYEGKRPRASRSLYWMPATSSVRLAEKGSRVVHLRDAQLGSETEVTIGRRELRADVTMCPTRAEWPSHPVGVRVLLQDPSGRIDASCEAVTLETTVNLTPVNVEWHHVGAWWWAQVAPQSGSGPWVVRVVAKDKSGAEIGRGHLEVITAASAAAAPSP
jgi:hypothetical protein